MLSTVLITDSERLGALRPAWEKLLASSATSEPTLHPAWLLPWWDVFGKGGGRQLRSLAFYDGEQLVALAPLSTRLHRYRAAIPFRRLEALASGEDQADESCSDYLGLLIEKGREREVCEALAAGLGAGTWGAFDELIIPAMSGEAELPSMLERALQAQGWETKLQQTTVCPYIVLPATWDEYLGALKQNKRAQLRKSLRAFEAWAGGPPEIRRATNEQELQEEMRTLVALHGERWTGSPKTEARDGVFSSRKFNAFHERATKELLAAGALDLGSMRVRGEPIAAFYNLRWNGKSYFYQSGRKLDVPDDVRVGVTMHAYLIRAAIEAGLREYDFLAGDSQYKMSLATATRPLVELRAVRPSAVEKLRVATELAIVTAKSARASLQAQRDKLAARVRDPARPAGWRGVLQLALDLRKK